MRRELNHKEGEKVAESKRPARSVFGKYSPKIEKITNIVLAGALILGVAYGAKRCGCISLATDITKETKKNMEAQVCSIVGSSGTNIFEDEKVKKNISWLRIGMEDLASAGDCECTTARGQTIGYSTPYGEAFARTEILDMIENPEKKQEMIIQTGDVIVSSITGTAENYTVAMLECGFPFLIRAASYIESKSHDKSIDLNLGNEQISMYADGVDEKGVTLFLRIEEFTCGLELCSTGRIKLNYDGTAQIKTEDGLSNIEDGAKAKELVKEIFGFETIEAQPRDKKEEVKLVFNGRLDPKG